ATLRAEVDQMQGPLQVGYYTQRVFEGAGFAAIERTLGDLLRDGDQGPTVATRALEGRLRALRAYARALVLTDFDRRHPLRRERFREEALRATPFRAMDAETMARVERETRRLAESLRGRLSVRRKRSRSGPLDVRRTLRAAMGTGGVPMRLLRRRRPEDRADLVVIGDISESMRVVARLFLTVMHVLGDTIPRTRTFVFVRDIGECTDLLRRYPMEEGLGRLYRGEAVRVADYTDYGEAFVRFDSLYRDAVGRRTTLVILGDARSNHMDPRVESFARLASRARRVLWLNPEPPTSFGLGDSVMPLYAPHCDAVLPVATLDALHRATTQILRLR
ncbi:MAG: VWA domain-containing protein, partial [Myxococcales bacterium]|nr:VWA domain-containing protein [Myxococcales bacterium]